MNIQVGDTALVTTSEWFFAPDGSAYRAVFGTVKGIFSDKEITGLKTNRHSSDWYLCIGNMTIAGCQIHYAVKTAKCNLGYAKDELVYEGKAIAQPRMSRIYNADTGEE